MRETDVSGGDGSQGTHVRTAMCTDHGNAGEGVSPGLRKVLMSAQSLGEERGLARQRKQREQGEQTSGMTAVLPECSLQGRKWPETKPKRRWE